MFPNRRSPFRVVLAVVAAFVCAAAFAAPASAAGWNVGTVVPSEAFDFAARNNASTVWNRQAHVFFTVERFGDLNLRHAWFNGVTWQNQTLDGAAADASGRIDASVGADPSVTVWNNQPHVFYRDATNGDLRHGWWTGSQWRFETLDGNATTNGRVNADVGADTTVTVWNNQPHVFYRDVTNGDMRHGWWTGTRWQFETLDGNGTANGRTTNNVGVDNAAAVWNGTPHVWYQDALTSQLRHAWWSGSAWFFETLDGNCLTPTCANGSTNADVGTGNTVAVWNNTPHVWYRDTTGNDLRHGWWTGRRWQFETLDGNGTADGRTTAAVTSGVAAVWNGTPHVWFEDATNAYLRHGWWTGTKWQFEVLDGDAFDGNGRVQLPVQCPCSAAIFNSRPYVWYRLSGEAESFLRNAWYG